MYNRNKRGTDWLFLLGPTPIIKISTHISQKCDVYKQKHIAYSVLSQPLCSLANYFSSCVSTYIRSFSADNVCRLPIGQLSVSIELGFSEPSKSSTRSAESLSRLSTTHNNCRVCDPVSTAAAGDDGVCVASAGRAILHVCVRLPMVSGCHAI